MDNILSAFWWCIAIYLTIRWIKGMMPRRNTRRGRVTHRGIEWE